MEKYINKVIHDNCLDFMKKVPDNYIDLTITSPPYNMRTRVRNGEYTTREKSEHFSKKYKHFDDALSIEEYYSFHKEALKEMMRISRLVFWNIQIVTGSKEAIFKIIGDYNKNIKDVIVWDKGWGQPAMHDGVLNRAAEFIYIFQKDAKAGRAFDYTNFKRGTVQDIWRIKRGKNNKENGATFPNQLVQNIINGWSTGGIVFDPFSGTGTTLITALENKLDFIGTEITSEQVETINGKIQIVKEQGTLF